MPRLFEDRITPAEKAAIADLTDHVALAQSQIYDTRRQEMEHV